MEGPAFNHAVKSQHNEGHGEELSHVEEHAVFEGFLILLRVFDEDAAGEYQEETETEEETCADFLGIAAVYEPVYAEKDGIANGLVELSRMSRQHVHFLEDKGPGYVCWSSDNLGVHKVAETDGAGTDRCDDGHVVEHMDEAQLHVLGIQPEGNHQAERAAMTGKPFVAGKLPSLSWHLTHGQQHLDRVRQIVAGLVKETMSEARTDKDAEEAVHEHRLELLLAEFLLPVEFVHEQIDTHQTNGPAQRVPTNSEEAQVKGYDIRVPRYE